MQPSPGWHGQPLAGPALPDQMALARTQKRAHARDLFLQHQQQQEPEGDAGWFAAGHRPKAARMEFVTHHRQQGALPNQFSLPTQHPAARTAR